MDCSNGTCGPQQWPRHVGETCTFGSDCKNHLGSGTNETFDATQCCPPADGSDETNTVKKLQDYAVYCPAEVVWRGGGSKLGGKCTNVIVMVQNVVMILINVAVVFVPKK